MVARQNRILLLIGLLALLGLVMILIATPFGIGTSPDSVAYIGTAQNLRSGQGLTVPLGGMENQPLTQFPPFYPLLLGILSLFGPEAYSTARLLAALLFAGNILLVGWILYRLVPESGWAAAIGSLGLLLAPVMLEIHWMAWSEPIFIMLGFSALFLLARYLETGSRGPLVAAALLGGLALLTRYAGVVFLGTGLLGILLLSDRKLNHRILPAGLFTLIVAAPLLLNLIYNQLAVGSATNRVISFHPVTRSQLWQGLTTLTGWLGLPASLPTGVHVLAVILGVLLMGAALYWLTRTPRPRNQPGLVIGLPVLIHLLALFALLYGGFLLISVSFIDANTPLDNRILSPLFISVWILVVYTGARLFAENNARPLLRWSLIGLLLLVTFNWTRLSLPTLLTARSQGIGLSSPSWQNSPTLTHLASLPENVLIYSNAPDAVYLLTGRPAARLPRRFELSSQQENADFVAQMGAIGSQMVAGEALIAFFTNQGRQSNPSREDLYTVLELEIRLQFEDGLIFSVQNSQP